jgi:hypothetical protein
MKAIVKNVEYNTEIEDDERSDIFLMDHLIGKQVDLGKISEHWYKSLSPIGYYFHESWLDFGKEYGVFPLVCNSGKIFWFACEFCANSVYVIGIGCKNKEDA